MKRTFLLTYTTVSGKTIDEFDELAYLYIKKDVVHYINVDHIESLDIEEVTEGQHITYDFE
ncbi:MAG: hypothetical protein E7F69_06755 [Staphylococcus epidermidis]|nr:hypothetical protein [Staphylococcus epidermidis]